MLEERWQMYRYARSRTADGVAELLGNVLQRQHFGDPPEAGGRDGQRFVIGPDGLPDLRVNWCLGSAKWRRMARTTRRDYSYSLLVWLNYLAAIDANWWDVDDEVATEFLFWRVTDPANERPVQTGSFARDLVG
ncbi:hypothetical protein [Nocardia sp. NPDC005366]|uniref:hypothetical protein n=1 Tax=Nocardia sp. NPDC005366 TaxID=3156878 RepID=UPI0033A86522